MSEAPLFEVEQFISFSDGDPAGIVFFANIFEIAHKTLELFKISENSWDSWFNDSQHGWPLRHAEAEFLAPIRVGRNVRTLLFLEKQGNRSIKFRCEIFQGGGQRVNHSAPSGEANTSDVLCAIVKTVHVKVERI